MSNVRCNHVLPNLAVFDVSEYRVIMYMYYELCSWLQMLSQKTAWPESTSDASVRRMTIQTKMSP